MGGSQSAQRVTLENPNPQDLNNLIRVSDDVVQRLKSPQRLAYSDVPGEEPEQPSEKKKPTVGTPVSNIKYYPMRDELTAHGLPYLTTKDIQEYVQAEVESTEKYWEERMKKLQEGHKRMEQTMIEEYTKAQVELEKHLPRKIPEDAKVPCTELGGDLAKCFKVNQKQSLKCLPQVEAFKDCLGEARKQVVQV